MGLMDKLKGQAEQVAAKAQQGTSQVQTRLEAVQAKHGLESLLRDLGAAYYAEQRQSGPHDAVEAALAALDAQASQAGPSDSSTTSQQPTPAPPADAPAAGDFKLDGL